jgi:hypothetical protein
VHRGSAMLAPIVGRDGRICGLHITWIDLNDPKGQARVGDPKTKTLLPAKKVSREQGRIVDAVHHCPRREAVRSGRSDGWAVARRSAPRRTSLKSWDSERREEATEVVGRIFPRLYFLVDDARYVTDFNAHIAICLLLAVWADDKAVARRLKGIITSPIQRPKVLIRSGYRTMCASL